MNSNLAKRTITGVIYGTSLIACLLLGQITAAILFLIIMLFALKEFYSLVESPHTKPQRVMGMLISLGFYVSSFLYFNNWDLAKNVFLMTFLTIFIVFVIELLNKKSIHSINNIALTLMGVIYVAIPMSLTFFISHNDINQYHYETLLSIFILVWLNDMGGYFIGTYFGKHKLIERISPKKSWEGLIGGCLLSLSGSIILWYSFADLTIYQWLLLSIIITIASVIGDLIESMIKRTVKVKDSGNILPGHGGFLDRFDSILFVIPVVYIFQKLIL